MRAHLWVAIQNMLDAAEYALGPLDNYSDMEDGEHGAQEPNAALVAHNFLTEAMETLHKQMEEETPK